MSLKIPKSNNLQLFKEGYTVSRVVFARYSRLPLLISRPQQREGLEDATLRNIAAVNELAETIRTSFGPNGSYCLH